MRDIGTFVPGYRPSRYDRAVPDPTRHPPVPTVPDLERAATALGAGLGSGAVLVRGLDVGDPGPTPAAMEAATTDTRSATALLAAASRLGSPVGYVQEHGGQVVQNIFPLPDSVGQQISTSSDVSLAFHTETAFHPHRSHYLLLLCLRGDPAAHTTLCCVDAIVPNLGVDVVRTLCEPRFRTGVDLSFGRGDGWMTAPAPVLGRRDDGTRTLNYDGELTVGLDADAAAALTAIADVIACTHTSVVLEAGDLLVIDNRRAVHGRSEFPARFDGTDRWLQRTFVVDDLAAIVDREGSVVTTQFRAAA
jgi:L-asparagine oxygenase